MTTVTSVWRSPDFRRVWAGAGAGVLGGEIAEIALPMLALLTLGASGEELSWVRATLFAPYLVLTLWLGVLVDRVRRRRLLVGADLLRAALFVLAGALAALGLLPVPGLVAIAAALGTLGVLTMLADFSFVPTVVGEDGLPDANAALTATQSAIGIGGSGVGGALVQALTAPIALVVTAFAHLAAAFAIARVRAPEPAPEPQQHSVAREAVGGLATLARHRVVRALAAEATLWNIGDEILLLALAVLLVGGHPAGALLLGVILALAAAGALVGAAASGALTRRFGYGQALIGALLVGNTAPLLGLLALADRLDAGRVADLDAAVIGVAFAASGLGLGVANAQAVTVRQLSVPAGERGRVNAAYRLLSWGALPLGALAGGWLLAGGDAARAALLGAALMAVATLPVAFSPVRRMRGLDAPDATMSA